jgi:exonuclease V gamma subunit
MSLETPHQVSRASDAILLKKLGEERQRVLKLLAQLELPGLQEEQVDQLLGELSAAILHLHEHTPRPG